MVDEKQIKLVTREEFPSVASKYANISHEAQLVINAGGDPMDILVLTVQAGSGFSILEAKVLNEDNKEYFIQLLKEGIPA
jgi:hypothetical protein